MCVACNYTIHRKDHNFAWSRDFAPALTCKPGETIHFECLDSGAGHFTRDSTVADVATVDFAKVNPVTGPVFIEGAEPGDAVKITFRKFIPSGVGWTANIPGFGLLADQFPDPALHIWTYDAATMAPALYGPKGRVPLKAFAGEIGLAPAEPGRHSVVPPRAVGGNLDIRDLSEGATLYLPVEVAGGLFSIGDTHAAQGDGEVCGTAIESQMDVELTLDLVKGANLKSPRFTTPGPVSRHLDGAGYEATTGVGPDLMTAAREAVSRMIDLIAAEHGLNPVDAYMLLLRLRRPAHQRDRRHAELGRVLLLSPHRFLVTETGTPKPILTVEGLSIDARTPEGLRPVLEDVSFAIDAGETLCLAGESGSGKSLTALSIMRLLSPSLKQRGGIDPARGPRTHDA